MSSYGKIDYMNWVKTDPDLVNPDYIDMANSSFLADYKTLQDLNINPKEIPLGGPNVYGFLPLIETIANRYSVEPDNVFPSHGTSLANYLLLVALFKPGDTILIEDPAYECLFAPAKAIGLRVIPLPLHEENNWRINVDEVAELVSITSAKGILLSNPHNPTGIFTPDDIMVELADAIGEKIWLIVDEVYREWHTELGSTTTALKRPNIISTTSLTKVWGLGGLRAGWCIAPSEIVQKVKLAYDHMGVVFPFPSDWIIHQVMKDDNALEEKRLASIRAVKEAKKYLSELCSSFREIKCTVDQVQTGYGVMSIKGLNGISIHNDLKNEVGVLVTPGSYFNMDKYIRITWCRGISNAQNGSEMLACYLNK